MRKHLYLIGGPMGVGKTAACRALQQILPDNVFLDGDWMWDSRPFVVNNETKEVALGNIAHCLNAFLACTAYENVIFCWVMHEKVIRQAILKRLRLENVCVHAFSLVAEERTLCARLQGDIARGLRKADGIERSLAYLPLYALADTPLIDTTNRTARQTAEEIVRMARRTH